jgi:hypothetical protein
LLNGVLVFFGLEPVNVLGDPDLATYGIIAAGLWPQTAYCMILYLTGLNAVDPEQVEAGRLDGAKGWKMLWYVILPQLKPATFIAFVVTIIGALRSFDLISIMTNGGPFGSTRVLSFYMFEKALSRVRLPHGIRLRHRGGAVPDHADLHRLFPVADVVRRAGGAAMSVTREEVDAICSALPGAVLAHPPELISWKVGGKMFACLGQQDDRRRFGQDPGRRNGPHADRDDGRDQGAILPRLMGAALSRQGGPVEARHRLLVSYDIVRGSLKKAERDALPERTAD